MTDELAIIPQSKNADGYVALAAPSTTRKAVQGKLFEKQILKLGALHYKNKVVNIDDAFADKLIANFDAGACDIVQMTVVDEKNNHTEDPMRNIGEVVGLTKRDGKVFAQVDVRDEDAVPKMGKTLLGASAAMYLDYTDTDSNSKVGPTMTHLAVTNRPYVLGLESYKEVISLSADSSGEAVILTATEDQQEEPMTMTKDELIALAKSEFGIDIVGLQATAEKSGAAIALSSRITEELTTTGVLTLSNGSEASDDDIVGALVEVGKQNVALSAKIDEIEEGRKKDAATARVESLTREGKILPKDKDAQIELLLSNPDLFERLVPDTALVTLSNSEDDELGTITLSGKQDDAVKSEVSRIMATSGAALGLVAAK